MKTTLILIFVISCSIQICSAEWQKCGISERIKANDSKVLQFVIDSSDKFIFSLDSSQTINKWNYETGKLVWSKQIHQDCPDDYLGARFFLSGDAKSYLTFSIDNLKNSNPKLNVFIHDMESDFVIDSMINLTNLEISNCSLKMIDYFAEYFSGSGKLLLYLNYDKDCSKPDSSNLVSGFLHIFQKTDKGFVDLNMQKFTNSRIEQLIINPRTKDIFVQARNMEYNQNNVSTRNHKTLSNYIFSLDSFNFANISDYSFSKETDFPNQPVINEQGEFLPFRSGFFDIIDSLFKFILNDTMYYFNYKDKKIDLKLKVGFHFDENLHHLFEGEDFWSYLMFNYDTIFVNLIYDIDGYRAKLKVDSLININLFHSSNDKKHLLITDDLGFMHKILYNFVSYLDVPNPSVKDFDFIFSPNPASGAIEISFFDVNNLSNSQEESTPNDYSESVELLSLLGENLFRTEKIKGDKKLILDISFLPRGLYFLKVGNRVKKLLKI